MCAHKCRLSTYCHQHHKEPINTPYVYSLPSWPGGFDSPHALHLKIHVIPQKRPNYSILVPCWPAALSSPVISVQALTSGIPATKRPHSLHGRAQCLHDCPGTWETFVYLSMSGPQLNPASRCRGVSIVVRTPRRHTSTIMRGTANRQRAVSPGSRSFFARGYVVATGRQKSTSPVITISCNESPVRRGNPNPVSLTRSRRSRREARPSPTRLRQQQRGQTSPGFSRRP